MLLLIAVLLAAASVLADSPAGSATNSLLLLRNGEVLAGRISRDGDRYVVAVEHGEMRIPTRDVDFQCDSLDQAYQMQSKRISPQQSDERIKLADWCLKQGLYDRAASEIGTVKLLDPRNPKVQLLDRRLQELQSAPASDRTAAGDVHRETRPAESDLPRRAAVAPLAGEDLERFARCLPTGTVESFSTVIQPLLLSHCGTAGCHGVGSKSDLVLLRPSPGTGVARRVTLRNLHTLLRWVDHNAPEESSLLTKARQPHGAVANVSAEDLASKEFDQLQAWVTLAIKGNQPVAPVNAQNNSPPPATAQAAQSTPEPTASTKRATGSPLANVTPFPNGAGWRNAIGQPHRPAPPTTAPAGGVAAGSKKATGLDKPADAPTLASMGVAPMPPLPDEAPQEAKDSSPLKSEEIPHAGFDPNAFRPEFKGKPK